MGVSGPSSIKRHHTSRRATSRKRLKIKTQRDSWLQKRRTSDGLCFVVQKCGLGSRDHHKTNENRAPFSTPQSPAVFMTHGTVRLRLLSQSNQPKGHAPSVARAKRKFCLSNGPIHVLPKTLMKRESPFTHVHSDGLSLSASSFHLSNSHGSSAQAWWRGFQTNVDIQTSESSA